MIEARHLSYFIAACQQLHLAKAADELDVAPSTLSMALKSLEEDLSLPLFAPAKVGLLPTPNAMWLYPAAVTLLHSESFARSFTAQNATEVADHVVIRPHLIFTIGRFAKAVSCVIEALRPEFPATFFEPRWDLGDKESSSPFAGRMASVTIDYEKADVPASGTTMHIVDDPWVLARELPASTVRKPSIEELLSGPIVVPALHPTLLEEASRFIGSRRMPNARFVAVDPSILPQLAREAPDTSFLIPRSVLSIRLGLLRVHAALVGDALVSKISAWTDSDTPATLAFMEALRRHLMREERNIIFDPQLTLRQIRYFKTIYSSRHLTAAAQKANIAQPALSNQLLKMETVINQRLFDRHRDGLVPTLAGDRLFQASAAISLALEKLESGRTEASSHAGGTIRIGVLPAIDHTSQMLSTIAKAIGKWREIHPSVTMRVLEAPNGALQEWLLEGKISLAIVETDLPQLARFNLGQIEEMAVVANPRFGLVNQGNISFSELQRLPLILPTSVFGIRQEIDATAGKVGVRIKPQLEINSLPMTIMLVRENPLVTILPPTTVSAHVARGDLICHRIIEPAVSRKLYAIYSDSRPLNTPERNFIRLLREGMAIIPPKTP